MAVAGGKPKTAFDEGASGGGSGATESIQTHEQRIVLYLSTATRISKGQWKRRPAAASPTGRLQIETVRLQAQRWTGVVLGQNTDTTVFSPNCALDEVLLKCANISGGQVVFQLNHVPIGGATGNANLIIKSRPLSPGSYLDIVVPGMSVGESIIGQSDTINGVNVTVYGRKAER